MSSSTPPTDRQFLTTPDFSLVLGGPLYQLWRGTRLAGDAMEMLHRRIITMAVVAWVPLLLLSIVQGHAWGDSVTVPFLRDVELHVRLLIALPLLVVAELVVHQRMRPVVGLFLDRGLIPKAARPQFDAAIASAIRLRNSVARRSVADRVCLRRRGWFHLAHAGRAGRDELVRRAGRRETAAVGGRLVAGHRQPAGVPVPAAALVFPSFHLGPLSVARLAHRFAASCRRIRIAQAAWASSAR